MKIKRYMKELASDMIRMYRIEWKDIESSLNSYKKGLVTEMEVIRYIIFTAEEAGRRD